MTPGLALFYGGMVNVRSVVNMLMMSFGCMAVVSVLWVLYGYTFAFGSDAGAGLLGRFDPGALTGSPDAKTGTVPVLAFAAFQLMFAIITPAIISGAIAGRTKFGAWLAFVAIWTSVVYLPVAHWVFFLDNGAGGWIGDRLGAIDFAGGTAVHINAGAAALALVIVLGRRHDWRENHRPHNMPLVLLGAGLLWFGWFGFNAGSALAANGVAANALLNTQVAAGAGALAWIGVESLRGRRASSLGLASGAVAGLVAITPACAAVNAYGALAIGAAAGGLCALAVALKYRLKLDDTLDVVGVHLVGGIVGSLLIGLFATSAVTGSVDGLLFGGGLAQLGKQAVAVLAVGGYSFAVSLGLAWLVNKVIGFRIEPEHERAGIDEHQHDELSYAFSHESLGLPRLSGQGTGDARQIENSELETSSANGSKP
jgi:Amt family ammonium transporter